VLLVVNDQQASVLATDTELEVMMRVSLESSVLQSGAVTLPGKKFTDIMRALPDGSQVEITQQRERVTIRSGQSRFTLATLPASEFPCMETPSANTEFTITQKEFRYLLQRTAFAMALQDVRYYLNGLLFEINEGKIRAVATDGHRLALSTVASQVINNNVLRVILPRKAVVELMHLLDDNDEELNCMVNEHTIRVSGTHFVFTSRLIDGRYPDYGRVLPKTADKHVVVGRELFKRALQRAVILSGEKQRGVRFELQDNMIKIASQNPEAEEAEDIITVQYTQEPIDTGINVQYLIEILNVIDDENVQLSFTDSNSSILVEGGLREGNNLYVVMPIRF
jgi:DNA polymerase-3 subunit beta